MNAIVYNIDFLISGLIFLILIMYHMLANRQLNKKDNRIFFLFLTIGVFNILFDIICTFLITLSSPRLRLLTEAVLIFQYTLQLLVPLTMFIYVQTMRKISHKKMRRICIYASFPAAFLFVGILLNHFTGHFFRVTAEGVYLRGPLYITLYLAAILYMCLVAIEAIIYRREMGFRNVTVIWEYLILTGICVIIQFFYHDILLTGFGIALALTVLFLTIKNPYEYTDNLTGLYDKQFFLFTLEDYFKDRSKAESPYLLHLSFRELSKINHLYSTSSGNTLLKRFAQYISNINSSNLAFRIEGNAFIILSKNQECYLEVKERLQEFFQEPFLIDEHKIRIVTVLCGLTKLDDFDSCDDTLGYLEYLSTLPSSEQPLSFVEASTKTKEDFNYRQQVSKYMNQAIDEDLFEIVYQPIYSVAAKQFLALEALSRLQHPTLGYISPELFFKLAEKNGQIFKLGILQFKKVCQFIKDNEYIMNKIHNVKFNLSALEIQNPEHIDELIRIIHSHNLNPAYFQFEITETMATEYEEALYSASSKLFQEAIGICLDDFGSGYANLNTVLKLPFRIIKLDRSLAIGICEDPKIALFYQQILSLFQSLGYQVIAEGIETEEELELIVKWGVTLIQGFYFSKPLSAEQLLEFLETH